MELELAHLFMLLLDVTLLNELSTCSEVELMDIPLAHLFIPPPMDVTLLNELSTSEVELMDVMETPLATLFIPPPMEVTLVMDATLVIEEFIPFPFPFPF